MPISIPAALGLTYLAKDVLGTSYSAISGGVDALQRARAAGSSHSLTAKVRETFISNTAVIDSGLAECDALPGMLNMLHSFVVGLITTALKMESHVTGSRTVKDHLAVVRSMEEFHDTKTTLMSSAVSIEDAIGRIGTPTLSRPKSVIAEERINAAQAYDRLINGEQLTGEEKRQALRFEKEIDRARAKNEKDEEHAQNEADRIHTAVMTNGVEIKDGDLKPAENLPFGKIIEITMTNPDTGYKESLPITVRMTPKYCASTTLARLIANYGQGLSHRQRWLMYKAGEIEFFRDFIAQGDQQDKLAEDLRKDHKGELADMISAAHKKNGFQLLSHLTAAGAEYARHHHSDKAGNWKPEPISSNLANTILIVSADTMQRAASEGAGNFDKYDVRQAFFNKSYSLALLVVDTRFDRVKIYINSIKDFSEYPFTTFRGKKDFNTTDMLKLMSGLASGRASVF